jgi:hypothetical protein
MDFLQSAVGFLVGGSVIAGVTYPAHYVDLRYGGILAVNRILTGL